MVGLVRDAASESLDRIAEKRVPIRSEHLFLQGFRAGVASVPLVALISMFVGLTMALLTGYQLRKFGLVTLVPSVVAISYTREMGALFTGIVLASRIGAAYTAELGAMTTGGEVNAIEGMGIGARRYLVAPRLLAIVCLTPCLTVIAVLAGIAGAMFISNLMLQLGYVFFLQEVASSVLVKDILAGVVKSLFFGVLIGMISCYKGLTVEGGAIGVGTATTSSVVLAVSAVIACDSFCNIALVVFFP